MREERKKSRKEPLTKMIYDLQKANMWKRISAYLFDLILLFIAVVGFAFVLTLIVDFDGYTAQYTARQEIIEQEYSVDLDMGSDDYDKLSETEKAAFDEAVKALSADDEAVYAFSMIFNLTLIVTVFSILISYFILEFVVPMCFGNGQTLGKKIFGLGVMRIDGVKISGPILFIRTILGKCTLETLVPVLIIIMIVFGLVGFMGPIIILLIFGANIVMLCITQYRYAVHDLLANTVVIDVASQLIFNTPEELLEYKQKIHAEMAEKAEY